jgi:transposase-like protein
MDAGRLGGALLHPRRPRRGRETAGMRTRRPRPAPTRSAFAGFRFPPDVIVLAVRWYLRFGLSYRDVEELLAERGIEVDHVTIYRWVLWFTPLLAEAARPCRHAVGDRWQVDETYVKVAGQWRYVYRAIDQFGQVIDVLVTTWRDATGAHRFFERAIGTTKVRPAEVATDRAPVYPLVLEELLPAAWHRTDRYANNRVEADHGRLKAWLRPMRGLKRTAAPGWGSSGMRSSRTFAADTTSWPPRGRSLDGCPWCSTSWPWRSDHRSRSRSSARHLGATQQRPYICSVGLVIWRLALVRAGPEAAGRSLRSSAPADHRHVTSVTGRF